MKEPYYNNYSKDYYKKLYNKKESLHFKATKNNITKLLNPKKGDKILDLGCGSGRLGLYLISLGCEVIRIDRNKNSIKNCKENGYDNVFLRSCDNIKIKDKFDKVLCSALVEHIPNKVYIKMLGQIKELLKPNGILVIYTPNPYHILEIINNKEEHIGLKNMDYLIKTLKDNGYFIEKSYFKTSHIPIWNLIERIFIFIPFFKKRICIKAIKN